MKEEPARIPVAFCSRWLAPALMVAALYTSQAWASTTSFTDQASFLGASGVVTTTNFESAAVNTTFTSGTGPTGSGFTLSGTIGFGFTPMVANKYRTTSAANYLGLNSLPGIDSDTQFGNGDVLTFSFSASKAFGLFVVGGSDLGAGDIKLSFGGTDFLNVGPATDIGEGSFAYYLGLVSDADQTSATVTGLGEFALFALDDVSLNLPGDGGGDNRIPEPASLALFGLALVAARVARGRR